MPGTVASAPASAQGMFEANAGEILSLVTHPWPEDYPGSTSDRGTRGRGEGSEDLAQAPSRHQESPWDAEQFDLRVKEASVCFVCLVLFFRAL